MKLARVHLHLLIWLLFSVAVSSCEQFGCSSQDAIAELQTRNGNVQRDFAAQINHWENAPVESTFVMNDGVRTKENATAELLLQEGSLVVMKPKTQLRFASSEPEKNKFGLKVEEGSADVQAKSDDLQIETSVGLATLKKGSSVRLVNNEDTMSVEVAIGSAKFVSAAGETFELNEGDDISLSIGTAQLVATVDDDAVAAPPEAAPEPTEAEETDAEMEFDSDPAVADLAPDEDPGAKQRRHSGQGEEMEIPADASTASVADFAILAGQRAVVHTFQFPVAVEFQFNGICPGDAHIKINKKIRGTGSGSVILNIPSGSYRYEVRCVEDEALGSVAKKGRVVVRRDLGKSKLSLSAPTSYVDADGRDYRLMYQSKLPTVVVDWPDAPTASGYTLHVTGADGTKSISLKKARHRFNSGTLIEGSYKFKFTISGSGKRSRTSSITIAFDNSTPKAILTSPKNGTFSRGASITVNGIALPGWKASVYGKTLAMDSEQRFSGTAKHLDKYLSLPVRLTHAQRGTHYFLRRAK